MIRIVFGLFFCCVATGGVARAAVAETISRPNVFLITIDSLRADRVHCCGDGPIKTPALDKLAKAGVRFAQAFTPSPITNASHTSILTILLPSPHGVSDFGIPFMTSHATLAGELKQWVRHRGVYRLRSSGRQTISAQSGSRIQFLR